MIRQGITDMQQCINSLNQEQGWIILTGCLQLSHFAMFFFLRLVLVQLHQGKVRCGHELNVGFTWNIFELTFLNIPLFLYLPLISK